MDFTLNRELVHLGACHPQTTLLDFLRSRGLTGAKEGCAEGECGACAVVLVKERVGGSEYRPVNSCLLFLPMVAGQEVYTVEGLLREGKLSDVQTAMVECGGSQCGYCTPGFVMSLFAEYYRPDRSGKCDPHSMSGNLCRCTGYRPIQQAALSLGAAPDDAFRTRLAEAAPIMHSLDHQNGGGRFLRPDNLPACLELLAAHREARIIAGGTDLAVESNLADQRWPLLLSVEGVPELKYLHETADFVEIGGGLTLSEIEARWPHAPAVIRSWFPLFASPLIRNRATLAGNLATASPIGDAAPLLLALGGSVRTASVIGERLLPLETFFTGYRQTSLRSRELIRSIVVPKPFPSLTGFYKVAKRRLDDISTVAAAFALELDDAGRITDARLAYGGVAATPVRVQTAEDVLRRDFWNEAAVRKAQSEIARTLRPLSDQRGSAEYRLAVAQSLLEKFLAETREEIAA
jgi:xanthine dehydrogenase small subunit